MPLVDRNLKDRRTNPVPRRRLLPIPPSSQKYGEMMVDSGCIWVHNGDPKTPHPDIEGIHHNGLVRKMTIERHRDFHNFCAELANRYEMDVQEGLGFPTVDAVVGYAGAKEIDSFTEVIAEKLRVPQVRYSTNDSGVKLNRGLPPRSKVLLVRLNIIGPEDPVFVVGGELEKACNVEVIPVIATLVNTCCLKRCVMNGREFSVLSLVHCPIFKFVGLGPVGCELCKAGSPPVDPRKQGSAFTSLNSMPFSLISPEEKAAGRK